MIVELINIGSELMLGRVLNTHQQYLCRLLSDLGCVVSRQVAVADEGEVVQQAVRESLSRADVVITTGGLGPTSDDITRDLIASMLGRKLHEDARVLAHIRGYFESRRRLMPEKTRVQALVPEGALVLENPHGTAPGLALKVDPNPHRQGGTPSTLFMLPGPPRELRPMVAHTVLPLIRDMLPPGTVFVCRTLRSIGIGESVVEAHVGPVLQPLVNRGLVLGYCARPGQVDVRLVARGVEASSLVAAAEEIVREKLGKSIYGLDDEDLERWVVEALTARRQTLAVAESCTGGAISDRLTNVPGCSAVLLAGLVTYSNAAKAKFLGVRPDTLAQHGAVSEPVAREMAEGALAATGADYSIAVTGIAGPGGGTAAKPVGSVFMAVAGRFGSVVEQHLNRLDRESFKQLTAQQALNLLRRKVLEQAT